MVTAEHIGSGLGLGSGDLQHQNMMVEGRLPFHWSDTLGSMFMIGILKAVTSVHRPTTGTSTAHSLKVSDADHSEIYQNIFIFKEIHAVKFSQY